MYEKKTLYYCVEAKEVILTYQLEKEYYPFMKVLEVNNIRKEFGTLVAGRIFERTLR